MTCKGNEKFGRRGNHPMTFSQHMEWSSGAFEFFVFSAFPFIFHLITSIKLTTYIHQSTPTNKVNSN